MLKTKLIILLPMIAILQGCVAAAGVAVVSGVSMATDERTFGKQIDDQSIEFAAMKALSANEAISEQTNLSVVSINGSILVIGQAPTPHLKQQAIQILNDIKGTVQIHDQIRLSNVTSITTRTNDAWLTTKVKTGLFGSSELDATNVKVITENGEVFLLGLVKENDANVAVDIARHVAGVSRVYKMFEVY